ncbi:hypothetical protein SYNTR_1793 [Candidatus Syntrophocurvum alkaliphilum]|uniref:Uncharacterized protein n=1 Tax=Candidatus Syntrophocurvum alkaliphilum TaxID=2293317 RepID=A0A6I6DJZ1_9FIRM|nr:hypothetical protein SYNTR_1793 [Candidatus Syntrophocurvum alkaliphilum]
MIEYLVTFKILEDEAMLEEPKGIISQIIETLKEMRVSL